MIKAGIHSCALQSPSCNTQLLYTFFQVFPSISVSKAIHLQNTTVPLFLLCTFPIWQQTSSQFRAPVHTGAGNQTVWPSGVSNTVLHPSLAFTSSLLTYFNSPTSPSSISIIFKLLLLSDLLDY